MPGPIAIAIVLVGCSTEYRLSSIADPQAPSQGPSGALIPAVAPDGPLDDGQPEAIAPPELQHHEVVIGGGNRTDVADYLFVVDSSSSMQGILARVLDGFEALSGEGVFPSDARIGVMNMLPEDPLRRGVVHPAAANRWWLKFEPGFGDLVDGERIAVFHELAPPYVADRFNIDGCTAWFAPEDRNDRGAPCLVANTQIALFPVGVEAGLTALGQRLERDPPLFRSGAAVNVIVVSDTHDPGLRADSPRFADLVSSRPSFGKLETLALSRQPLASFRLHAIAPATVCTSEDWTASGASYYDAAHAGGGHTLDSCTADPGDYVSLIRHIATEGAVPQRAVIPVLGEMEVAAVLVDGEPTLFTLSADGRALTLAGDLPTNRRTVDVQYRVRGPQAR